MGILESGKKKIKSAIIERFYHETDFQIKLMLINFFVIVIKVIPD